jgi:DNA-binding transcriptional regulator YiaG
MKIFLPSFPYKQPCIIFLTPKELCANLGTMKNSKIANTFKSVRKKYNLSQVEFSKLIGCSRVSLSNYETGTTVPGAKTYARLLELQGRRA